MSTFVRKSNTCLPLALLLWLCATLVSAQENLSTSAFRKVPIILGLQFNNSAVPFKDMGSNLDHPGVFVGSELIWNKKGTFIQQASIGGYLNKEIGNGFYLNTQLGYRPSIYKRFYGQIKIGLGYLISFHPTQAYRYEGGRWEKVIGGKSLLNVPVDIGLGYRFESKLRQYSPFISYQVSPVLFYNKSLPLNLYSNIILGVKVNLKK